MSKLLELFMPGSFSFFFLGLSIGFVMLFKQRTIFIGRYIIGLFIFIYLFFSIPISARWLAYPLTKKYSPVKRNSYNHTAQALVLLDAGTLQISEPGTSISIPNKTAALRLLELIRVYKLLDSPLVIISTDAGNASKGQRSNAGIYQDQLIRKGIPQDRIVLDSISENTLAHAENVKRILKNLSLEKIILITSPSHMPRSMDSFVRVGIHPIASPSQGDLDQVNDWRAYFPSMNALEFTQGTLHEYLGIFYYYLIS